MEIIESVQNKQVKEWKKLLTRRGRSKQQKYLVEGDHLVEEAIKSESPIDAIIIRDDKADKFEAYSESFNTVLITTEIAELLSDTVTNQGLFAVINIIEETEKIEGRKPVLLLDEVQDPGNLGTLIRTADAAGFEGVVIGKGSVDLHNPKALRSAQGSHFHLPVIHDDLTKWIDFFEKRRIAVFGTALDSRAISYRDLTPPETFALIVGNEGSGVNPAFLKRTTENLYIPIKGEAESLNVAVAASVLMFSLYQ
ncbi:MAG: RNA methyltransferase [Alkalibacterium sp.]|nr:RNA methyltransferase [Alkalibacterium sp.]TVP93066.1 MAG: RNA methyltransferase [Alkalibacterium sp.]